MGSRVAGYTLGAAAGKLGVEPGTWRAWEQGSARPTVAKLREAAALFKRPLAISYLPEPPRDYQPLRDFRRLPDAEIGRLSLKLVTAVRWAHSCARLRWSCARWGKIRLNPRRDSTPGAGIQRRLGTRRGGCWDGRSTASSRRKTPVARLTPGSTR